MPRIDINMVPGMNRELPGHALHRDGVSFARILNNLRPTRGELERRPGLTAALDTLPTRDGLSGTFDIAHIEEIDISPGLDSRYLVATTQELFIVDAGSWSEITPTYTAGTVSVTNGSDTVTGSSTEWDTRGIYGLTTPDGCWFKGPDGDWYNIKAVNSDTEIVLSTNYGGSTASGQSYTIKRTLGVANSDGTGSKLPWFLFTQKINQDLYVAGPVSGGFADPTNAQDGGVLKVTRGADFLKTSFSASDVSYIFSGQNEVESGIDFADDRLDIYGFGVLSDGRLVLVTQFYDSTANVSGGARVHYSSHLNVAVWSTSPGGFTDLIDYEGSVTAASFSTISAAIHFTNGIEVADLTGQDDPPLRFRPSRASNIGAVGPRMIASAPQGRANPGSEIFLGTDLRFYSWNGVSVSPLEAAGLHHDLIDAENEIAPPSLKDIRLGSAITDLNRSEVSFLIPFGGISRELRYNYDSGAIWRATYSGEFYAQHFVRGGNINGDNRWENPPEETRVLVGTDTGSSWVWALDETNDSDDYDGGGSTGGIYALFEGISFSPEAEWNIQEILVYCRNQAHEAGSTVTWKIKWWGDQKTSGELLTASAVHTGDAYENDAVRPESVAIFKGFDEVPVREFSFVLASNVDNLLRVGLTRIQIFVSESTADVRAT